MTTLSDRYEAYYTEKLWQLLPQVYHTEDSPKFDQHGPLRELVHRLGVQAAIVRRSIDRMWEDQSIETCDAWVIAYIGDLLATNLLSGLDARGQRLDVARSISYRRRKGTVGVLEQLAYDLTGWNARVVEFFRRIARTRHGLDPEIGWPADTPDPVGSAKLQSIQRLVGRHTRTSAGGFADVRNRQGQRLTGTAFDEYNHTVDVRFGRGKTGWYNIPRLGVFLWRLHSLPLEYVEPVPVDGCPNAYSFDPTGRRIPLFADSSRTYGDTWVSPDEHQVPGPISRQLPLVALPPLYATMVPGDPPAVDQRSFGVFRQNGAFRDLVPLEHFIVDPGADPTEVDKKIYVDTELGLLFLPPNPDPQIPGTGPYLVAYHYGFASTIGAGAFERRDVGQTNSQPANVVASVTGGGNALVAALQNANGSGTVLVQDSLTYKDVVDVVVDHFALRAENKQRPLIRFTTLNAEWVFEGSAGSTLEIDGIFIAGCDIVLKGEFESVTLKYVTFDPGTWDDDANTYETSVDGRPLSPCRIFIEGQIRCLTIDRSVVGPVRTRAGGNVERMIMRDSIIQSLGTEKAISLVGSGEVEMDQVTVMGPAEVHRLHASNAIFHDIMTVADTQYGCVRFSAYAKGSMLPRRYETAELEVQQPIFTSTRFGEPGYAQLGEALSKSILEGGTEGSEPGAFWREKNAIKERSLRIRYQEYTPAGLSPVFIYVT